MALLSRRDYCKSVAALPLLGFHPERRPIAKARPESLRLLILPPTETAFCGRPPTTLDGLARSAHYVLRSPVGLSGFGRIERRSAAAADLIQAIDTVRNSSLRRLEEALEKSAARRTVVVLGSEWSSDTRVIEILDAFPIPTVVHLGPGAYFRTPPMRCGQIDPAGLVHVGYGTRENWPAAQTFIDESVTAWIRVSSEDLEVAAFDKVGSRLEAIASRRA